MEKLSEILKDLEQGKISANNAEEQVLRLFNVSGQVFCNCIVSKVSDSEFPIYCNNCNAYVQKTLR